MKKIVSLITMVLVLLLSFTSMAAAAPLAYEGNYTITGPIKGGSHGWPYGAYFGDIQKLNYVEEEYFIEGTAKCYKPVGELTDDGEWTLETTSDTSYKTRIIVRRPTDPAKFNGTVLVEWADMSNGYELSYADAQGIYENGFAYVSVTAQKLGADNLKKWDKARYDSLNIHDDGLSYDIFTQAARAVSPDRVKSGIDPMGGLDVKKLIAVGCADAGSRMLAYINGVQPEDHTFDALMPVVCGGQATDFNDNTKKRGVLVRDDLSVPVMVINSQSEALTYEDYRQSDTDVFRSWEIAGAAHTQDRQTRFLRQKTDRDGMTDWEKIYEKYRSNEVNWLYTMDAAFLRAHEWITVGELPSIIAPIEIKNGTYALDEYGNVLGGVRLPEMEVPCARYVASPNEPATGYTIAFSTDELKKLYPKHENYVTAITEAAERAEDMGVILPYHTKEYTKMAETTSVPVTLMPDLSNKILNTIIVIGVVVLLVIALIIFLIVRKIRRKRRTKNEK